MNINYLLWSSTPCWQLCGSTYMIKSKVRLGVQKIKESKNELGIQPKLD